MLRVERGEEIGMPIVDFAGALAAGEQDTGGLLILAELTMHSADFTVLYALTEIEYVDPAPQVVFPPVYVIARPPTAHVGLPMHPPVRADLPGLTTRGSPPASIGLLSRAHLAGNAFQPFAWNQGVPLNLSILPASTNAIHAGQPARIELELFDGNQQIVSQARVPFQQLGTMLQGAGPSIFDAGSTASYTVTLSADTFV
jgi:hypothetical protein